MKENPAYYAIEELQLEENFKKKSLKNQAGKEYYLIELPSDENDLELAGMIYHPEKKTPHLSCYKYYRKNTHGLTVYHYTWYGFRQIINKNGQEIKIRIKLHAYFNWNNHYSHCQLKNQNTGEVIDEINEKEQKNLRNLFIKNSKEITTTIFSHITKSYEKLNNLVNEKLKELERMSRNLETQKEKKEYVSTAKVCLENIIEKNIWSFFKPDPRGTFLTHIIKQLESHPDKIGLIPQMTGSFIPNSKPPNQPEFKSTRRRNIKNIKKNVASDKKNVASDDEEISREINLNLNIKKIEQSESSNAKKSTSKLKILEQELKSLMKSKSSTEAAFELIKRINNQYDIIRNLFKIEVIKNNPELSELEILAEFLFDEPLDLYEFNSILAKGSVDACEFIIQKFEIYLFLINHLGVYAKGSSKAASLLLKIMSQDNSLPMFTMLLRNGADPNMEFQKNLLYISIISKKIDYTKALLEHGANPNPKKSLTKPVILPSKYNDLSIFKIKNPVKRNRMITQAAKTYGSPILSGEIGNPLYAAIQTNQLETVKLLLAYGASISKKINGLNAIGKATCSQTQRVNHSIVEAIIKYGGEINSVQGDGDKKTTPLQHACQRNDISSVKFFIDQLNADPNQKLLTISHCNNKKIYFTITPFQKAVLKGYTEIIDFLMGKKDLLTFNNILGAFAHSLLSKNCVWPTAISHPDLSSSKQRIASKKSLFLNLSLAIDKFNNKEEMIKNVRACGVKHWKNKKFYHAILSFYKLLILGNEKEYQTSLYYLGDCYANLQVKEIASRFLRACKKGPAQQLINLATLKLGKLENSNDNIPFVKAP